ncbi:MAG: hypothetical protein B7X79_12195 [Acidovorax sp. 17-64-282]|nr:MAG: hypothetical protein B7Y64_18685 [Acidovorax sp. 35-64-16]OYZ42386.1 MAG: hypothetical protein B7Y20_18225 [Acidovorax sp. 16-64-162]OYZ66595.1 MAG: hypothetical protein B7Y14_16940 [Acidovorax sp. 24-64-9]OZA56130.1 MAG: hypothetical protein B7X79_12195 [Acidovorax sp. 17-64-282]OZA66838.1 MAG: hypothetical protein B7X70_19035 [Acidovorax sp. 39-64-12]
MCLPSAPWFRKQRPPLPPETESLALVRVCRLRRYGLLGCPRRSKFEPPCRLNIEPGVEADFERVGCG